MPSDLQIAANRNNALRSTGPKTEAGKKTVSRNAIRHGLAAEDVCFIDGESPGQLEIIISELIDEYRPATRTEAILVERMATAYHHSKRALVMQNDVLTVARMPTPRLPNGDRAAPEPSPEERIRLLHRYHKDHDRNFLVTLAELRACQALRKADSQSPNVPGPIETFEIGFAPESFPDHPKFPEDLQQPEIPAPECSQIDGPEIDPAQTDRQCRQLPARRVPESSPRPMHHRRNRQKNKPPRRLATHLSSRAFPSPSTAPLVTFNRK